MQRRLARARQRQLACSESRLVLRNSKVQYRKRVPSVARLASALVLAAAAGAVLLAAPAARADDPCIPSTEVAIPFHFSTKNRSVWGPGQSAYAFDYRIGKDTGVIPYGTGAKYVHLVIPALYIGKLRLTPEIDLGTWGGELKGSFSANAGLHFNARATGGSIDADVPLNLILKYPQQQQRGANFIMSAAFSLDPSAKFQTYSPNATARLSCYFNASIAATASLELAGGKILNNTTIFDGQKYGNFGTDLFAGHQNFDANDKTINGTLAPGVKIVDDSTSPHKELTLFDFNAVDYINNKVPLQYEKKDEEQQFLFGGYFHIPQINTTGQVQGSSIVSSGHDWVIKADADITNLLTWGLRKADIPIPDFNFTKQFGPDDSNLSVDVHMLDLRVTGQLGFQQDFRITPQPHLRLHLDVTHDNGEVDSPADIDLGTISQNLSSRTEFSVLMPGDGKAIQFTPYLTFNNGFSSRLSIWGYTGLDFDLLKLDVSAKAKGHDLFTVDIAPIPTITKGIDGTIALPDSKHGRDYLDFYNAAKDPATGYAGDDLQGFVDDSGQSESTGAAVTVVQKDIQPTYAAGLTNFKDNKKIDGIESSIYERNEQSKDREDNPFPDLTVLLCSAYQGKFQRNNPSQTTDFWWDYNSPGAVKLATLDSGSSSTSAYINNSAGTQVLFTIPSALLTGGRHTVSTVITYHKGDYNQTKAWTTNLPVYYHTPYLTGIQNIAVNDKNEQGPETLTDIPAITQTEFETNTGIKVSLTGGYFSPTGTTVFWQPTPPTPPTLPTPPTPLRIVSFDQDNTDGQHSVQILIPPALLSKTGNYQISVYNDIIDATNDPSHGGFARYFNSATRRYETYYLPVSVFQDRPTITGATKHAKKTAMDASGKYTSDPNIYALSGDVLLDITGGPQGTNQGGNYCQDTVISVVNVQNKTVTPLATTYVSPSLVRAVVPEAMVQGTLSSLPGLLVLRATNPLITTTKGDKHGGESPSDLKLSVYNPAPVVSTLSPDTVPLGNDNITMTITGQKFTQNCSVIIPSSGIGSKAMLLDSIRNSDTSLTVLVPRSVFANLGVYPIQVVNTSSTYTDSSNPPARAQAPLTVNYPVPGPDSSASPFYLDTASARLPLTGGGFYPATTVKVNNLATTTTYTDGKNISVAFPDTLMGAVSIVATNPTPGGGVSTAAIRTVIRNVTPSVTISRGRALPNGDGSVSQTVTVTANKPLNGPVSLLLDGLSGAKLLSSTARTKVVTPTSTPFVAIASSMRQGQKATITLRFDKTPTWTGRVVAGAAP